MKRHFLQLITFFLSVHHWDVNSVLCPAPPGSPAHRGLPGCSPWQWGQCCGTQWLHTEAWSRGLSALEHRCWGRSCYPSFPSSPWSLCCAGIQSSPHLHLWAFAARIQQMQPLPSGWSSWSALFAPSSSCGLWAVLTYPKASVLGTGITWISVWAVLLLLHSWDL